MVVDVTSLIAGRVDALTGLAGPARSGARTGPVLPGLAASRSGGNEPPSGNTGVEITGGPLERPEGGVGLSLGWLSCTWVGEWLEVRDFLNWSEAFIGELHQVPRRWRGYETVYQGQHGILAGFRWRDGEILEVHLDIPATLLESLEHEAMLAFLERVAFYALNVSRADLTLDDWDKSITPFELETLTSGADNPYELNKESLVTRASQSDFRRSKGPTGGDTWYLGSSKGDARLRVYDKARESGGKVDAIRWELQLRGDRAKDAVVALYYESITRGSFSAGLAWVVSSQLVRFVDFRDRSQDSNISRCPRLSWFEKLVGNAEKAKAIIVKPDLDVRDMHRYARKALPSWLATLADSADFVHDLSPEEWILEMLALGRQKRSARHALALSEAGVVA